MPKAIPACPHCGVALPSRPDAYCPECRNPLEADPFIEAAIQVDADKAATG